MFIIFYSRYPGDGKIVFSKSLDIPCDEYQGIKIVSIYEIKRKLTEEEIIDFRKKQIPLMEKRQKEWDIKRKKEEFEKVKKELDDLQAGGEK